MFEVAHTEAAANLSRDQLWAGLVRKAEFPLPFVHAISACRILRDYEDGFEREVCLRGATVRERVTFEHGIAVRFERLTGPTWGVIENRIVTEPRGCIGLRFSFRIAVESLAHGSAEERAFAERMGAAYLAAICTTICATQQLIGREGAA